MLITGTSTLDGRRSDVRICGGVVVETAPSLDAAPGEEILHVDGGTVLPGLHDHHVHLFSLAAAASSVAVGPDNANGREHLTRRIRSSPACLDGWVRGVGYHESVAGPLDRRVLDDIDPHRPTRIQHRTGAMWFVNSAGLRRLGMPDHPDGRLFRQDDRLTVPNEPAGPALAATSTMLAEFGVTGITEATPSPAPAMLEQLDLAVDSGALRQRVHVLTEPGPHPHLTFGPVKRILDDATIDLDELRRWILTHHENGKPVALHCVTVLQLVVAVDALEWSGPLDGDRIEHAAMTPIGLVPRLRKLQVTVVTQPNFVAERGSTYLSDVPSADRADLWRVRTFFEAGIPIAGSTDAPFGHPDPWSSMRAARDRRTANGVVLGDDERVSARRAVDLFLGSATRPSVPRRVQPGSAADLCVLSASPRQVLDELSSDNVVATVLGGTVHRRGQ